MTQILQINSNELEAIVKRCFLESLKEIKIPTSVEISDRISIDDVSQITGLKKSVVYKKTCENSIPYSKFAKRLVFSRKAIISWMESRTVKPVDVNTVMAQHLANEASKKC